VSTLPTTTATGALVLTAGWLIAAWTIRQLPITVASQLHRAVAGNYEPRLRDQSPEATA
jgi:hypothetical protein